MTASVPALVPDLGPRFLEGLDPAEIKTILAATQRRFLADSVILLDIGMPRLNGIEAARQILQASPGTKIVFWSEYTNPELVDSAFKLGAKAYIAKSAKSEAASDLIPAIEAVLEEMLFVSKVIAVVLAPNAPSG